MKATLRIKLATVRVETDRSLRDIIQALEGLQVAGAEEAGSARALIYELGTDTDADFAVIETQMCTEPLEHLFLVAPNPTPGILMRAIKTGVREFFSLPLNPDEIGAALVRLRDAAPPPAADTPHKSGQVLHIIGSKGGVGTTTVAVNLAAALTEERRDLKVALLDMNTLFGDIPLFLDLKSKFHWGEITKNIHRLDDTFLANILEPHSSGIKVLTSPAHLNGHTAPTPEIMDRLLGLMRTMFDFVIVDGGQSTDDTCLRVLQVSEAVLLVSVLSLPCLANTNKLLKSLTSLGYASRDKIRVVINRYLKKSDVSLADAEEGISQKPFWVVPNDYRSSMSAINQGKPLVDLAPRAAITESFRGMARALAPNEQPAPRKRGFFSLGARG
jgi:pilus assembly protein CpaE